jgi:hypothetical protein
MSAAGGWPAAPGAARPTRVGAAGPGFGNGEQV